MCIRDRWEHQVGRVQARLGDQAPHRGIRAQAARAVVRKWHGRHLSVARSVSAELRAPMMPWYDGIFATAVTVSPHSRATSAVRGPMQHTIVDDGGLPNTSTRRRAVLPEVSTTASSPPVVNSSATYGSGSVSYTHLT